MIPPYNMAVFKRNIDTFFLLYPPPPPYLVNRLFMNVPASDMILPGAVERSETERAFRAPPGRPSPKKKPPHIRLCSGFGADAYSI